jgi:hypothetical protein
VRKVRAGPDPEVATVINELIGEKKTRKEGERSRRLLVRRVAVNMGAAGSMRVGRDIESDLGLVKRHLDTASPDQVLGDRENASGVKRFEEDRGLIGRPPIEVVADTSSRRWCLGDQSAHFGVQSIKFVWCNQAGDHEPTKLGERKDLLRGQHVAHRRDVRRIVLASTALPNQ